MIRFWLDVVELSAQTPEKRLLLLFAAEQTDQEADSLQAFGD